MATLKEFFDLLSHPGFLQFFGTYGLAVLLVLYFILFRDRQIWAKFQENQSCLEKNYKEHCCMLGDEYCSLSENLEKLQNDYHELMKSIHPETICMSRQQALKLNDTALDRDLYKIYYRMHHKIDGISQKDIPVFLKETILDTNETWREFCPPFSNPDITSLADLYDMYTNGGKQLGEELEKIFNSSDLDEQEKKNQTFTFLLNSTINQKKIFREAIEDERNKRPVKPCWERNSSDN